MQLVLVNGLPGTGKTTMAKPLAAALGISVMSKDSIKEFLFDHLGARDRDWSSAMGMAANDFIYVIASVLMSKGESLMVENAFEADFARPRLRAIIEQHRPRVTEVYCTAETETRRKRFIARNEEGRRHVGHADAANYDELLGAEPLRKYEPLGLGALITVDTTVDSADIAALAAQVRAGRP